MAGDHGSEIVNLTRQCLEHRFWFRNLISEGLGLFMSELGNDGLKALGGLFMLLIVVGLWVAAFALMGWMFDYSLWSILGKDVPWYADVAGGVVSNGILVIVTVGCWIARLCGYEAPFVH
jgi:hypothetical protein